MSDRNIHKITEQRQKIVKSIGSPNKSSKNMNHVKNINKNMINPYVKKNTSKINKKTYTVSLMPCGDWFTNDKQVDISIIIPCYKSDNVIKNQIETWDFCHEDGLTKEIIYVDDCDPTNSRSVIYNTWSKKRTSSNQKIGKIVCISPNSGFANACNTGASFAQGKYLLFLNADTKVTKNWIKPMYDVFVKNNNVGIVGNLILKNEQEVESCGSDWNPEIEDFVHVGGVWLNGRSLEKPMSSAELCKVLPEVRKVMVTTGCCFMISQKIFTEVGHFDCNYIKGYFEDSDLCIKVLNQGYDIYATTKSKIYHQVGHSKSHGHAHHNNNKSYFHTKWVATGIVDSYLQKYSNINILKNIAKDKKLVIYSAITNKTNNYDSIKELPKNIGNVDKILFLEQSVETKSWKVQECHKEFSDPCRNAKIHKILSHKYFPEHDFSLWIDGSVKILFSYTLERLINIYLQDSDIALFKHNERKCIYQEAEICKSRNLDDHKVINTQIAKYRKENFPQNCGLSECTVLLRKHSQKMVEFNELWWKEICAGSRRDQLSFDYCAKKVGIKVSYFSGNLRSNNYLFFRESHK